MERKNKATHQASPTPKRHIEGLLHPNPTSSVSYTQTPRLPSPEPKPHIERLLNPNHTSSLSCLPREQGVAAVSHFPFQANPAIWRSITGEARLPHAPPTLPHTVQERDAKLAAEDQPTNQSRQPSAWNSRSFNRHGPEPATPCPALSPSNTPRPDYPD